ncbi:uncharacterized protein LOC118645537 [Monomorium pharaonis]|uniref:uncharacterized protein LOC118645537 n=1 Tax=Monomorium pharaonis TaxID=307658 RepID=UPI001746F569|nr:uncharacterized protein LOC118645537 [Monomorium pharaonis]
MSVVESQTPRAIRTETPMQTLSKCEFCYQQIPLVSPIERARVSNAHCFQHTPQWGYPAIVQFVHGEGVGGVPCCPGCKCTTNTTKTQKQQSQQQRSRQLTQQHTEPLSPNRMKSNSNETMTSEATQQVASKSNIIRNCEILLYFRVIDWKCCFKE